MEELTLDYLISIHPSLFSVIVENRNYKENRRVPIEKGWYKILEKLVRRIKEIDEKHDKQSKILQIKEKFGGLRVYLEAWNLDTIQAVREAEDESYKVCEKCGEEGHRFNDGWILTLCEEHAKERWESRKDKTNVPWEKAWSKVS